MSDPRNAWFEYYRTKRRVTAYPVNAKGWIALIALAAFPLLLTVAVTRGTGRPDVGTAMACLGIGLAVTFGGIVMLLRTRGRARR